MVKTALKLTVFFEEPFWVGVFERKCNCRYEVFKITYGTEPKDCEIFEFVLNNYTMLRFSQPLETETVIEKTINPKRMQRAIRNQMQDQGIGTKAQQALKLQHEQNKLDKKNRSREQLKAEKEHQYELKKQKRKDKHRGH